MSSANLDAADLAAALSAPGLIREDVVDQIYNLDEGIPTPLIDMVAGGSFSNLFSEWTENDLAAPDIDNAVIDGADATGNDTVIGARVGNRAQLSDKVVRISHASEGVDSIGSVGRIAYQVSRRMMDLRRDMEAIATGRQASVADDGAAVAGRTAGLAAWIETNAVFGALGSAGGYDPAAKVVDAPTEGTVRALTWELVRDGIEAIYNAGGNPSTLMSLPTMIKKINNFLFSSAGDPFRATPTANVTGTGGGIAQTAQGFISVVLSDFGITLSLVDNRLQQFYNLATAVDVFILDPSHIAIASMDGFRQDVLGKTGHAENRLLSNTWMTKVFREDAHALIADVDHTAAVTAT
jgi:hypothetical protein